jgi:hypothetical protein
MICCDHAGTWATRSNLPDIEGLNRCRVNARRTTSQPDKGNCKMGWFRSLLKAEARGIRLFVMFATSTPLLSNKESGVIYFMHEP